MKIRYICLLVLYDHVLIILLIWFGITIITIVGKIRWTRVFFEYLENGSSGFQHSKYKCRGNKLIPNSLGLQVSVDLDLSRISRPKIFPLDFYLWYDYLIEKIVPFRFAQSWGIYLVPFKSYKGFPETPTSAYCDQGWSNLPRWVQWRYLFSVSKQPKSIKAGFLKFQILLLFNVKGQYVENLAAMLLDRFETENKYRHCTHCGKWLQPWSQ